MERVFSGYRDLHVYQKSYSLAMDVFREVRSFPREERRSLTDQLVRSSRSIPANIAEGWRKRSYEKMFVSKMLDASGEAAETEVWIDIAKDCGYLSDERHDELFARCKEISAMLFSMASQPEKFYRPLPGKPR